MSKQLIYAILIIVLLALNIIFPKIHSVSVPNFLFLLVVISAFQEDGNDFLWLAFFAGLMLDIFSNTFFGTYTVSFLLIAMIISYTTKTFIVADPSVQYIAAVVVIANLFLFGLVYIFSGIGQKLDPAASPALSAVYLEQKIWIDIVLNLIFAWPTYLVSQFSRQLIAHYQRHNKLV